MGLWAKTPEELSEDWLKKIYEMLEAILNTLKGE